MSTHFDFSGQTVLVTGGAQGRGRSIVEGFAASGAKVLIADLNLAQAHALVASLQASPHRDIDLTVARSDAMPVRSA